MIRFGAYILKEPLEISIYNSHSTVDPPTEGEWIEINGVVQKLVFQGPPKPEPDHPMLSYLKKSSK